MEPLALASISNLTASSRELEVNLEAHKLFKINKVRATTKLFLHLITPEVTFPLEVKKTLHFSIYKIR